MPIRKSVFGSRAERHNFLKLSRQWSDRYRVYHNLPFLNVIAVKEGERLLKLWDMNLEMFTLTGRDLSRLKKTSIDFVLCDGSTDQPVAAVDFDGMYNGYSRGRAYLNPTVAMYEREQGQKAWRREVSELKLKVAHAHMFPYLIVGYRFFEDLTPDVRLTIVDGVLGEALASNALHRHVSEVGFKPEDMGMTDAEWDELDTYMQDELVQDWLLGLEIATRFEHNPIAKAAADLDCEVGAARHRFRYLEDKWTRQLSQAERMTRWQDRPSMGIEYSIFVEEEEPITRVVWIPNFGIPGFSGYSLLEDMGKLLTLDAYRRLHLNKFGTA